MTIFAEIEADRRAKWEVGQKKYGTVFVGHPLKELDEEFLDAMNYVEEAERWGYDTGYLMDFLRLLCWQARLIYAQQPMRSLPVNK